ncbi:BIG1-domain-containing protein [Aureobasidium namibiae CBS 147.97]|uniref:Protein BIG1 n=1 Tax=Aureobasidium namibiae CBS 147.97 TaxID=1043004 RepID=A0A074WXH2_9PEZI
MLLRYLSAAALALQSANAFKDASPFVLYSTSQHRLDAKDANVNVISAQSLQQNVEHQIKGCPTDKWLVVSQPGLTTDDLTVSKSTPHLRRRLAGKDNRVKSVFAAKNVVGHVDAMVMVSSINRECSTRSTMLLDGEKGEIPSYSSDAYDAIHVQFPALPTAHDDRESALLKADSYLNSLLATIDSYTVLYATLDNLSPPQVQHPEQYVMDEPYPSNMHTDLKRDLNSHIARASNASNPQANLPLFEKYQFLSPGIFMGGVVSILLFSILYVGISAIAGLEVSYMAFSKEMGPAAQKKQQQ